MNKVERKSYVTEKFIKKTWDRYPESQWQFLRLCLYKGRYIKVSSKELVYIEDVRKEGYADPEFMIEGEWVSVYEYFNSI